MKRKLLVALMAVAMTASLAACGGGTDAPAAETPAEEAEETPLQKGKQRLRLRRRRRKQIRQKAD